MLASNTKIDFQSIPETFTTKILYQPSYLDTSQTLEMCHETLNHIKARIQSSAGKKLFLAKVMEAHAHANLTRDKDMRCLSK